LRLGDAFDGAFALSINKVFKDRFSKKARMMDIGLCKKLQEIGLLGRIFFLYVEILPNY
jgi:hypothetical protein